MIDYKNFKRAVKLSKLGFEIKNNLYKYLAKYSKDDFKLVNITLEDYNNSEVYHYESDILSFVVYNDNNISFKINTAKYDISNINYKQEFIDEFEFYYNKEYNKTTTIYSLFDDCEDFLEEYINKYLCLYDFCDR